MELTQTPGSTIRFLKYAALSGKSDLAETALIETKTLSTSTVSISVAEHALAIGVSELLLRQSQDDVMQSAAVELGRHYAKDLDRMHRDILVTLPTTIYAGGRANRAALTTADIFDVDVIRDAATQLAINKAPKINGDSYVCFIHPRQQRAIAKDPDFVNIRNYANPENYLSGEIGRIDDVRFVVTTHNTYIPKTTQDIFADQVDTGDNTALAAHATVDVHQAYMVGDYCLGHAIALDVQMRDGGIFDFGRTHKLAYYHISGCGLIEPNHGLIIESAV